MDDYVDEKEFKFMEKIMNKIPIWGICLLGILCSLLCYYLSIFELSKAFFHVLMVFYFFKLILGNKVVEVDDNLKSVLLLIKIIVGAIPTFFFVIFAVNMLSSLYHFFFFSRFVLLYLLFFSRNFKNYIRKLNFEFYNLFIYNLILVIIILINRICLFIFM